MKVKYDCIGCLSRQFVTLATKLTEDEIKQQEIISYGLKTLSHQAFDSMAPEITGKVCAYASQLTGVLDPYYNEKRDYNDIAFDIIDKMDLKKKVLESDDPFDTAVRLSIAGNIIDFSVGYDIDESTVEKSVQMSLETPLYGVSTSHFKEAISNAKNILFLSDNSGEIVFDQLLVSLLPKRKINYVVKGGPIVNDATMEDAISTGMDQMVSVIETGSQIQGTLLDDCHDDFKAYFEKADLIISKGQANFETLSHLNKNIYFLLRAKCQCVADEIGCEKNDFVIKHRDVV
ncbi:DUF89 family protein [Acidaminobacter sp. JC074]|uniref:damage-control phosphatase ARMT1 family protein n=1 Tax=Acidaminobacter sp. JC074 TaxID=2530199 RepID=UPI001F0F27E6|nr:ARMT1-like domain-containing protein [Acidaminobacter sp. JC074]MCH4886163.1 DUF89 family protein [Acidaminobacter sp. JC074]